MYIPKCLTIAIYVVTFFSVRTLVSYLNLPTALYLIVLHNLPKVF